ncbi:MAG: hypothetical protein Q9222_000626 [Ikaeria aurantiellina]
MPPTDIIPRDQIASIIQKARIAIFSKANTTPISIRQEASLEAETPDKASWVTHLELPAPPLEQGDIRQVLIRAIEILGRGDESYIPPSVESVHAQWTSSPPKEIANISTEKWSDEMKYGAMMNEVGSRITIFYIQGGAFILNTAARFRKTITGLATMTKGRCFSINYRLAPQHPFPAALLDVLIGYLSLLYPPPGSYHSPVLAPDITLAGDSSGACLCLALIQIILSLRKSQATDCPVVRFHGRDVILHMPSGLALQSQLTDQTNCLPSWQKNSNFDLVQEVSPVMLPEYPPDSIWPSDPPRGDIYCESSMICHPLVSPVAATSWAGAPPIWFALGEERMVDGAKTIVQRAAAQGVDVHLEMYEAMPHNWPMLFPTWWQSKLCMQRWAIACESYLEREAASSSAESIGVDKEVTRHDVGELTSFTPEEALSRMRAKQATLKPWRPMTGSVKL